MNSSINFAIVGCGRIAQRHAEHISKRGKLVAVCDIVQEKAVQLAADYGTKAYTNFADMLANEKDIDVIAVCSPNGLHAQHSIDGLKAGFHVLCEKPMGLTVKECGEMIQTAERANKRLFAIKQNRYNPPVAAVKDLIDTGKLGNVLSVQLSCFWNRNTDYYANSWKGTKDLDGGTFLHSLATSLIYYTGSLETLKTLQRIWVILHTKESLNSKILVL